jgi:hypothetical protein
MATNVPTAFTEFLGKLDLTAAQKLTAKTHISNITSFLNSKFVMDQDAFYTGSYRRGTIVRWNRDVDIMAPLSYSEYATNYDPNSSLFLYMVRKALNDHFGSTKVSTKQVAIKIEYSDIVADVVPCFGRTGGGFFMPNGTGGWLATNPPFHTKVVKEADEANNLRLKPLARLMKAWNIANGHHLTSIHVELMVEAMWRGSTIGTTISSAVAATLKAMPSWLDNSFPDPWPDGRAIDAELSATDRSMARRLLRADVVNAQAAEAHRHAGRNKDAIDKWRVVFGDEFPA